MNLQDLYKEMNLIEFISVEDRLNKILKFRRLQLEENLELYLCEDEPSSPENHLDEKTDVLFRMNRLHENLFFDFYIAYHDTEFIYIELINDPSDFIYEEMMNSEQKYYTFIQTADRHSYQF